MKQRIPESGVLRACLDLLAAERIWHRRWNTGAVKTEGRFFRFGQCGDADILATPCGYTQVHLSEHKPDLSVPPDYTDKNSLTVKVLWIECKSDSGKQAKAQQLFQKEVEREGHYYLLVRDVDQLREWLRANGVIR